MATSTRQPVARLERSSASSHPPALPPRVDREGQEASERLIREGHRFNFFQAVWLLERLLGQPSALGEARTPADEHIRIRPHPDRVFPATDMRRVEWTDEQQAEVTVTFMGLYGIDAPLPVSFHDKVTSNADGAEVLRDFLDIFNQRLYAYYYRSWKKYRPGLHFDASPHNAFTHAMLSLAGLGTPGVAAATPGVPLRLVAFASRFNAHTRNAEGLQVLLTDFLAPVSVRIDEHVPRWVALPERAGLGGGDAPRTQLGVNTVLGSHVFDVSGKFRVVLGPLNLAQFETFQLGRDMAHRLDRLVRLYAPDFLDYDVELLLDTDEITGFRLGFAQLGRTTWLGRPSASMLSEVVAYT